MHINLMPNAKPVYSHAYPITRDKASLFKDEIDRMCEMGVLEPTQDSGWGSPTFGTPKKNGEIQMVLNLIELNKVIKRKHYPLPIIQDLIRKRHDYEFFSKLDISMQYWTFVLDEESRDLCTIVTPFYTYRYCRAPMGLANTPAFAQAQMEKVLAGIEDQDAYIDDIGAFSMPTKTKLTSWPEHLELLDEILTRLEKNNFTVNPGKWEWGVKETDFLGYWLTPTGIKPWGKKVEAILKMTKPVTITNLRAFLDLVGYHADLWPRRSHTLAPLTTLGNLPKGAILGDRWTPECDKAFQEMKSIIATDCLMAYPNHNKPFYIYTDASDYQMGTVIMQYDDKGILRPVAYFSRKLNAAQRNYTVTEKELLSIVMVLKDYRTILYGAELKTFTDHKNLTFNTFLLRE